MMPFLVFESFLEHFLRQKTYPRTHFRNYRYAPSLGTLCPSKTPWIAWQTYEKSCPEGLVASSHLDWHLD
jgi:hypothetical protein